MFRSMLVPAEEKVLTDREPKITEDGCRAARDERVSFQLAYLADARTLDVEVEIDSPLKKDISVRVVDCVPCTLPDMGGGDDYYLSRVAFLCPDVLREKHSSLTLRHGVWSSLWFTVSGKRRAGDYPIKISLTRGGDVLCTHTYTLSVGNYSLGESDLICTDWFHYDGIAQYYRLPVFSPKYNRIMDDYIRHAVGHGINMILVPLFTPALDTRVGGERLTVQLLDVTVTPDGGYTFDFSRLLAFLARLDRLGVRWFEFSHFFTQWGAEHAPKIVAKTPQGEKRIFGWETDATGPEYSTFLSALLPQLKSALVEAGYWDRSWFHVSDEPNENNLPAYTAAHDLVLSILPDLRLMDAASRIEYYDRGLIATPIPVISATAPFLERGNVPNLWTYYCCGPDNGYYPNRFMAMPGERTRVLGLQLWLSGIVGFLHWGYNFYNSVLSDEPIDPYLVTDSDGSFPSGDAFSVYPSREGGCLDSLRLELFYAAIQDRMLMKKLEEKRGRAFAEKLLADAGFQKDFHTYPRDLVALRALREKIHASI